MHHERKRPANGPIFRPTVVRAASRTFRAHRRTLRRSDRRFARKSCKTVEVNNITLAGVANSDRLCVTVISCCVFATETHMMLFAHDAPVSRDTRSYSRATDAHLVAVNHPDGSVFKGIFSRQTARRYFLFASVRSYNLARDVKCNSKRFLRAAARVPDKNANDSINERPQPPAARDA